MARSTTSHPLATAFYGAVAVVFGLILLFSPNITLETLVLLFGVFAVVGGLVTATSGMFSKDPAPHVASGLLSVILGVVVLLLPGLSTVLLLYLIAIRALVVGAFELFAAVRSDTPLPRGLLGVSGAIGVIFGLFVMLFPGDGALAIAWLIGLYAMLSGILILASVGSGAGAQTRRA